MSSYIVTNQETGEESRFSDLRAAYLSTAAPKVNWRWVQQMMNEYGEVVYDSGVSETMYYSITRDDGGDL